MVIQWDLDAWEDYTHPREEEIVFLPEDITVQ